MEAPKPIFGHLAALFTIVVWGITFISIKVLLVDFTPVEIMFYRSILALLALFIASLPRLAPGKPLRWVLRDEWKYMAAGLCGITLYMLFQNIALTYTLAANVSVLVSIAPLLTALVSRFFFGFAIAIAGIILIAFNGSVVLKLNPLGDLLSILAALVWAFYSVLIKKISAQDHDMLRVTRKVFFYGVLFMLPILPLFDFRLGVERLVNLPNLLNLLFLGIGASALCFVTWNYAVKILGPVRTSIYIYTIPLVTIIASVLALNEPITLVAGIGIALILLGMALSEHRKADPA